MSVYAVEYTRHEKMTDDGVIRYIPGYFLYYVPASSMEEVEELFYDEFDHDTHEAIDIFKFKGPITR